MLVFGRAKRPASAHVIVLGNEKGGSGKSTMAMHVTVALMNGGQRVATVDLDSRQKTFTHYIDNRRAWAARAGLDLRVPIHFCIARGAKLRLDENEAVEFGGFAEALTSVEHSHDFVVVDTPGADSYLTRLAHCMADTLVTPLNDSFVDFDVLGTVDPSNYAVTGEAHYGEMVRDARRQRRLIDGAHLDWVVVRNRMSAPGARHQGLVGEGLYRLGAWLGFRFADGFAERALYRELFPRGLTALDGPDETKSDAGPGSVHAAARKEVTGLIEVLRLPHDERGRRRAAARAAWFAAQRQPLDVHDVLEV